MTESIKQSVLWLVEKFGENIVFGGSFSLVLQGKLDRQIKDLDVILKDNNTLPDDMDTYSPRSGGFELDGVLITVQKIITPQGIDVDIFFPGLTNGETHKVMFEGVSIELDNAEAAIKAKIKYLQTPNKQNFHKHFKDLQDMGVIPKV